MHVERNIEAHSRTHFRRRKEISIKYYESVYSCLSYPACKVLAPYYIVLFGLSDFTTFSHIVS